MRNTTFHVDEFRPRHASNSDHLNTNHDQTITVDSKANPVSLLSYTHKSQVMLSTAIITIYDKSG